jgi:hypothetical protein
MRTAILLATAVLAACGPSLPSGDAAPGMRLDVAPDTVAAGDSVVLTLHNDSAGAIGYNLCTSGLERQSGNDWQSVPSDRICTMELRTLEPGADARYPMELPAGLLPGEYRFHTTVELMSTGSRSDVRTDPFNVRP